MHTCQVQQAPVGCAMQLDWAQLDAAWKLLALACVQSFEVVIWHVPSG